jgi:nitrous oxide reductase accessory protein NosL
VTASLGAGANRPRHRPAARPRAWLVLAGLLFAAAALAAGQEDVARVRECSYCGMDRQAYGYSRALVRYRDGGEVGVCSLHCAVTELDAHPERQLEVLLVADRNSHELIEASAASWVMGGHKRAVMAARPKWAFATPEAAAAFVRESGGELIAWPQALAAAREDVASEVAANAARRAPRPMGCAGPAGAAAAPAPRPAEPR